jgi:hypothetical protein
MNRRSFLTLLIVSPAVKVYRVARGPRIPLDQLVRVTMRKYAPALKQALYQESALYKLMKEKL